MGAPDAFRPVLHTDRLELRPLTGDDVDALHALLTDADVRRYLLDDEVVERGWVEDEVHASEDRFAGGGAGLWALRERNTHDLIGFVGFRPFFDPPELQLLYGLAPGHWGQGFATEAARTAVAYVREQLGYEEIRAAADMPNAASIAVLQRLGFEEWRRSPEGTHGTVYFRILDSRA